MLKREITEFGELYQSDDYEKEIAQSEIFNSGVALEYKKNIVGQYFNAKEGRRVTCFQPKEYIGTIYLLGPCTILGAFVDDQFTIASYLQKKLLKKGYSYLVENCGTMSRRDSAIECKLQEIGKFNSNDIVIVLSRKAVATDIPRSSLEKIYEKYDIPDEWIIDSYMHCNYKANQFIADGMLEMIESCLLKEATENCDIETIQIDFCEVMKDYVRQKYLNIYFKHFIENDYGTIGAIVMNCNPFSKGHRYLIEQARQQVDFLIIFVVEEDASLFSFEERFKLVEEGTKDLENVMVVPGGKFILSKDIFQEYFTKDEDEMVALNAEYDINMFADYIAKPLRITRRFAGEEPEDMVTNVYNEIMKKKLPQKGIVFTEIPRITTGGKVVSASRVRKYLRDEEYDKAFALLPETTKHFLMKQI